MRVLNRRLLGSRAPPRAREPLVWDTGRYPQGGKPSPWYVLRAKCGTAGMRKPPTAMGLCRESIACVTVVAHRIANRRNRDSSLKSPTKPARQPCTL